MTALETASSPASTAFPPTGRTTSKSAAPLWRNGLAVAVGAHALGLLIVALPSHGQTARPDAVGPRGANPVASDPLQIDARTLSCRDLQARVRDSGPLAMMSGLTGGGTFHAARPRCEFWERPQFSFVMAQDGWCGAGYVCAAKLQG